MGKGLIIVLTGQRRVGKSCLLQCVTNRVKDFEDATNVIYINKEYAEFRNLNNADDLIAYVESHLAINCHNYLFVDEVQDIDGFENALRNFHAKDLCDIVVTGSNAKMLSGELTTYLSGRYVEVNVQPLSYEEFLAFHHLDDSDDALTKYLSFGGLPQLAHIGLDNKQMIGDYLRDVYNTVIMKDVITRESIRNVRFLTDLVRFVGDNIGKNFSALNISKFMRSQGMTISPALTSNYLGFLSNAYIINPIPLFNIHGKRLLETNEKYYFGDIGLRNSLTGINLRGDIEKLLENVVYLHLRSCGYTVTVGWLRGGEVDFVGERNGRRIYVQVCYMLASDDTIKREFGSLSRINDDYPKMVITLDTLATQGEYNGIACQHLRQFLLDKNI